MYTNPNHVIEYSDGEVRQQFSLCFATHLIGGELRTDNESTDIRWVTPHEIDDLPMHPSMRLRIAHYEQHRNQPYLG